ncbi:cysteine ABC transporter substrate-binding protein [Streptococcus sp. VTCC 12886]|uniref:cysteine ABC transporter substrate-binding protein n=1 Tax=Streptococcus sp. VTCC 12886 TaxID=3413767 RepID=UPI003D9C76F9
MKIFKPIFAIFSVLAAVILVACSNANSSSTSSSSSTSGATARTLEEIKESGTVKIGVFSDKKPFGYVDANGEYQGYDVYLGNRLAKELGVEVEYIPVEAANRVEYLTSAKVDIILANFTVTDERKEQVDFALPYMKVSLGIVSPSSAVITDPEQLNGKTLIVSKGTTAELYFEENYPEVKLQKYNQYSEAYAALLDGRGDAMSTDNTEVLAWALENKGFEVGVKALGDVDTIAPAVQKGNTELLDFINQTIEKLGEEEFFHKAYQETLQPVYGDAAQADDLVVEGGVIK